ncbi:MAG: hypothetical protein QOH89_3578 [Pseudonocardiales bacterium]|jgi:hypothetical protein|nr:hypothetical protein [Pseudonocardiales bacterium]
MRLLKRRESPPVELVTALGKDERVVSWADTDDGGVVAATQRGLWWPEPEGPRCMPWQFIDKVVWRDGRLIVIEAEVDDDLLLVDRPAVSAVLTTPRDLPPVVRKRVEGNIVRTELATVDGGAVRFVARRQPGRDGVAWWARLEPGTPDSDEVRSAVRARVEKLRAEQQPT